MVARIPVVIPSHKRAGRVKTLKLIPSAILCVSESQAPAYAAAYPGVELLVHSDDLVGLGPKRQWICDTVGDVFMADDDLVDCRRIYAQNATRVEPDVIRAVIDQLADTTRQLGAYLFSFSNGVRPNPYKGYMPYKLTGYVNSDAWGVLAGSKISFTLGGEALVTEDYIASLWNAFYHRMAVQDFRFFFGQADTFAGQGGQAEYRDYEAEKHANEVMRHYFGTRVVVVKKGTQRLHGDLSHPYQRSLSIPF